MADLGTAEDSNDPRRLWSLEQLAAELGVHVRPLRDAARSGRLEMTYGNRVVFRNPVPTATRTAGLAFLGVLQTVVVAVRSEGLMCLRL